MKLTHISKAISFKQMNYIKEYIDFNTKMRARSKSDFEKDFYKLMNNSVFGKTMRTLGIGVQVKLGDEEFALKQAKKSTFKRFAMFDEDCIALHMYKTKVKFDQPIYLGFSELDLSKLLIYEFYYDKLKKYDTYLNLLYMDTDSYFVETKKDPYKIIKENSQEFYTSVMIKITDVTI